MDTRNEKIQAEYRRILSLVENADPTKAKLLDGLILEAARTKIQLDELNRISEISGVVAFNPSNPSIQKTLPVAQELTKTRASYTHIMDRIARHLSSTDDLVDGGFDDFI